VKLRAKNQQDVFNKNTTKVAFYKSWLRIAVWKDVYKRQILYSQALAEPPVKLLCVLQAFSKTLLVKSSASIWSLVRQNMKRYIKGLFDLYISSNWSDDSIISLVGNDFLGITLHLFYRQIQSWWSKERVIFFLCFKSLIATRNDKRGIPHPLFLVLKRGSP